MPTLEQLPGELNIKTSISDDFSFSIDCNINLTGYTFLSSVVKAGGVESVQFTITNTDLSQGKLLFSITKESLATIGIGENHRWWFKWASPSPDSIDRKILSGNFTLVS